MYGDNKVQKSDLRIEVLGNIDELNSLIGVLVSMLPAEMENLAGLLIDRQNELFRIGAVIAAAQSKLPPKSTKTITVKELDKLEDLIDLWQEELPELKNFILPGGKPVSAYAHLARAVCRRAERSLVRLQEKYSVEPILLAYFNRLGDWLFVMARKLNQSQEILWTGK